MKKKSMFKVIIASATIMFGLSSCNKCQTCTYNSSSEKICQEDFNDKEDYKAALAVLEAFGAKCK